MDAHQSAPLAIGASTCADATACSVFVRAKPVSATGTGIARAGVDECDVAREEDEKVRSK